MPEETLVEQKCKNCGGAMRFDPENARLVCDFCGSFEDLTEASGNAEVSLDGFDFGNLSQSAYDENAAALPIYNCRSCGAEVITPPEQAATTCPYCGNNIVLTDKVSGHLRPDAIVPFKIGKGDLKDIIKKYCKGKKLLSSSFFSSSRMNNVTGVYIPFWVFNGNLSGTLTYDGEKESGYMDEEYEVTETSYYRLVRDVSVDFEDLPIDASNKTEDALMDSILPYDMSEKKSFDMRYLAGFAADRFDVECSDIEPRAVERMKSTAESIAGRSAAEGYSRVHKTGGELKAHLTASYLLLPVYLFEISHRGKDYAFAVNGQTGKAAGTLPKDGITGLKYFLSRAGIVAACVMIWFIISYFRGR